jgi:hypothetical protein
VSFSTVIASGSIGTLVAAFHAVGTLLIGWVSELIGFANWVTNTLDGVESFVTGN